MALTYETYTHKPLEIEAVEITKENIRDVAELIGTVKEKDSETPYIHTDRRIIPNFANVGIGWWLTKVGDNYRCYKPRAFERNYELRSEETSKTAFAAYQAGEMNQ